LLDLSLVLIHSFRMPLFFVMSGYFAAMLWVRLGTSGFLRHRLKRIALPFLVGWCVVYIPTKSGFVFASQMASPEPLTALLENFRSGAFFSELTTAHLWFLYYLLYLYVAALTFSLIVPTLFSGDARRWCDRQFRRMASSAWRPLVFAVPTAATLSFMRSGALDTETGFVVTPKVLAAYGVFFAFGWLLHNHSDLLTGFPRHAWKQLVLAVLILPVNAAFVIATVKSLPAYNAATHLGAVLTGSVMVWLLIFCITGLFVRYFDRPNPRIRYVADASYWMYIVHLPLMIWIPVLLAPVRLPALVKVAIVFGVSVPLLFLSYHTMVRYTIIGEVLNGKRLRRKHDTAPSEAAAATA
jgi:peptidoglycan/LPS O-acetylase OafA/YrhL